MHTCKACIPHGNNIARTRGVLLGEDAAAILKCEWCHTWLSSFLQRRRGRCVVPVCVCVRVCGGCQIMFFQHRPKNALAIITTGYSDDYSQHLS